MKKKLLLIGGTDSSGGAGIAADIQTAVKLGASVRLAVNSVTAQTKKEMHYMHLIPVETFRAQMKHEMHAKLDGIKIGMLPNNDAIDEVVRFLQMHPTLPVVLDPVLETTSKGSLIIEDTKENLLDNLLPLVSLITPNAREASILSGQSSLGPNGAKNAAEFFISIGVKSVLIKGGHLKSKNCKDILLESVDRFTTFERKRFSNGSNCRGTGCRLATAITYFLAHGESLPTACRKGGDFVADYIEQDLKLK